MNARYRSQIKLNERTKIKLFIRRMAGVNFSTDVTLKDRVQSDYHKKNRSIEKNRGIMLKKLRQEVKKSLTLQNLQQVPPQ